MKDADVHDGIPPSRRRRDVIVLLEVGLGNMRKGKGGREGAVYI